MKRPLYFRVAMGSGTASLLACISATASATTARIPASTSSGEAASQLRLGNSAHRPTFPRLPLTR